MLAKVHGFANLDEETEAQFDEAFSTIVGACSPTAARR